MPSSRPCLRAAVEVHRARDVAEEDEPDLLPLPLPIAELDEVAAREVRAQRPPEIDPPPALHRTAAAAHAVGEAARDLDGELEQLLELLGAERGKILIHER